MVSCQRFAADLGMRDANFSAGGLGLGAGLLLLTDQLKLSPLQLKIVKIAVNAPWLIVTMSVFNVWWKTQEALPLVSQKQSTS